MITGLSDVVDALRCFEYNEGHGKSHNDLFEDNDLDTGDVEKVEKGRERNREHAKRTRLRKKAVLEGMKGKLMELQNEVKRERRVLGDFMTIVSINCLKFYPLI